MMHTSTKQRAILGDIRGEAQWMKDAYLTSIVMECNKGVEHDFACEAYLEEKIRSMENAVKRMRALKTRLDATNDPDGSASSERAMEKGICEAETSFEE